MSLFQALSDMSKQHTENSGSYTFEKPAEPHTFIVSDYRRKTEAQIRAEVKNEMEEEPTVSLYNLLDHSAGHLSTLHIAVQRWLKEVNDEYEPEENPFYSDLKSWNTILEDAVKEKSQRDSEAWAEKTATSLI